MDEVGIETAEAAAVAVEEGCQRDGLEISLKYRSLCE
jgi:hypothetical protein